MSSKRYETLNHLLAKPTIRTEFDAALNDTLAEARRLQIKRMEAGFDFGWQIPKDICSHYRTWYTSLNVHTAPEQDRLYKASFDDFLADMEEHGGFPAAWSSLDAITLFGEICTGQRREDGRLKAPVYLQ